MGYYVYVLSSRSRNAIYVGVTSDLRRRLAQHREGSVDPHTRRYRIELLVYFEEHATLAAALTRAKRLKRWRRAWKDQLVASVNPGWCDLGIAIPP